MSRTCPPGKPPSQTFRLPPRGLLTARRVFLLRGRLKVASIIPFLDRCWMYRSSASSAISAVSYTRVAAHIDRELAARSSPVIRLRRLTACMGTFTVCSFALRGQSSYGHRRHGCRSRNPAEDRPFPSLTLWGRILGLSNDSKCSDAICGLEVPSMKLEAAPHVTISIRRSARSSPRYGRSFDGASRTAIRRCGRSALSRTGCKLE